METASCPLVEEHEWVVQVYRKTSSFGWQCLQTTQPQPTTTAPRTTTTTRSKKRIRSVTKNNNVVACSWFLASPRRDAIIVRSIRLRITIDPATTVVTRRRNRILVESERGARSIVLVFQNQDACRAFSDCFLRLNPPRKMPVQQERVSGTSAGGSQEQDDSAVPEEQHQRQEEEEQERAENSKNRQEVYSYIVRLLHMPNFLEYVQVLEQLMHSQPDGRQILQDLITTKTTATVLPPQDDDKAVGTAARATRMTMPNSVAAPQENSVVIPKQQQQQGDKFASHGGTNSVGGFGFG